MRTPPAAAPPLARALDEAGLPEALGAIAGDDTIFIATRDARDRPRPRPAARGNLARRARRALREGA